MDMIGTYFTYIIYIWVDRPWPHIYYLFRYHSMIDPGDSAKSAGGRVQLTHMHPMYLASNEVTL